MTNGATCPIGGLEKILLATDRSEYSEGAIREAIKFASKCSSRIYASMTIETNPEYETIGSNVFEKEEGEATAYLDSIKARAVKEGVACETTLHESTDASQAIVDEAAEKKVDMIVIGRHGRKGVAKALMGEVAAKVIAHAPCKVLVVPRAAQIEYRNILVATDGSAHAVAALNEAIAIAKRCGSRIIALSAMRDETEREEARNFSNKAAETAKKEGVEAEAVTPTGRSFNAIVETAGGRGVDLIVMGTYGKTGLKKVLMGSSTEKVIGNAGCAVLVVKA
ncbi:MAG: universal stress protein [Nitrospirota bacterium]|jgi:nucleotide-binding universal stress UspA family protein